MRRLISLCRWPSRLGLTAWPNCRRRCATARADDARRWGARAEPGAQPRGREVVRDLGCDTACRASITATPRAICGPGSNPAPGLQGEVPAAEAASGKADNGYVQHADAGPRGHRGRLQGRALRRQGRPRVRLLRHDAPVLDPGLPAPGPVAGRGRARHVQPVQAGAHRDARDAGDAVAARVAAGQPEARAAGRGAGQPDGLPGPGRHLRPERGLPPSGAAVEPAGRASSATRAASRPTATPSTRPRCPPAPSPRSTSATRSCR